MAQSPTSKAAAITPQDLDELEHVLSDFKNKAQKYHDEGNQIMHTLYVSLVALVSPVVVRAHARMEREHLANQRRQLRASKKATTTPTSA